jgi:uncharacterized OB-fold protein
MKCPKCGSKYVEWSPIANGVIICKDCGYHGVPSVTITYTCHAQSIKKGAEEC